MPTYVMLTRLTDDGCETIKKKPHRVKEVKEEVEEMGGKVLSQYVMFGPYDFLNIIEAPDNETISKISLELASRGTVRVETYPLIEVENFIGKF